MTAQELLERCQALGVKLAARGGTLHVRGPASAKPLLRDALLARKAELLELLAAEPAEQEHELFEERAAIMEYDGHLPRAEAERRARFDLQHWQPTGLPH